MKTYGMSIFNKTSCYKMKRHGEKLANTSRDLPKLKERTKSAQLTNSKRFYMKQGIKPKRKYQQQNV